MPSIQLVSQADDNSKHCYDVSVILFHDGKIFTAADDGKVKIWSENLSLIYEFQAHNYAINHILILDGILYTASVDLTIKCWALNNYELQNTLAGHVEPIRRLKTDGKYIFAGDENGEVQMWSKEGKLKCTFFVIEEVWDLHVEEKLLFSIRNSDLVITERIDDTEKYTILFTFPGRGPMYINENFMCILDVTGRYIQVFSKSSKKFLKINELKNHNLIITAITGYDNLLASADWEQKMSVWDLTTGTLVTDIILPIIPSALATNGSAIFVGGTDGHLIKYLIDKL